MENPGHLVENGNLREGLGVDANRNFPAVVSKTRCLLSNALAQPQSPVLVPMYRCHPACPHTSAVLPLSHCPMLKMLKVGLFLPAGHAGRAGPGGWGAHGASAPAEPALPSLHCCTDFGAVLTAEGPVVRAVRT